MSIVGYGVGVGGGMVLGMVVVGMVVSIPRSMRTIFVACMGEWNGCDVALVFMRTMTFIFACRRCQPMTLCKLVQCVNV